MKLLSMDFAVHGIQFYRDGYFPSYLNTHNYFNLNKWHDVQGGFRTFYIRNPKGEQSLPEGVVKKELFVSGINPPKGFEFDPAERDQWVQKLKAIIDGPERKSYHFEIDPEGWIKSFAQSTIGVGLRKSKADEIDWLDQDSMPKYMIPHFPNKPWYGNGSATISIHLETTMSDTEAAEVFTAKQVAACVLHEVQHAAEQTREKVIESTIPNVLDWTRQNPTVTIGAADLNRMLETITELPSKEEWATGMRHIGDAFWRTIEGELYKAKHSASQDDDFPYVVGKDCSTTLKASLPPDDADWSFTGFESAYDNGHWDCWHHPDGANWSLGVKVSGEKIEVSPVAPTDFKAVEDKDMIEVPNPSGVEYKLRKIGDMAQTLITYAQGVEMFAKLYHVYDGDAQDGDDFGSQLYNLLSRTSADCDPALLNEVAAMVKKISDGIIADKGGVMHPHAIVLTDDRKLPVAVCSVHGELCTIRYVKASAGPTIEIYPVTVESEATSYRETLESVCELMVIWKALSDAHLKWGERGSYILQAPENASIQVDGLTGDLRNCLRKLEAQFNQIGPDKLLFKLIHTPTAEAIKAYSIATVKASVLDGILKQWEECEIGLDHAFKAPIISLHETIKNAAQVFKETKSD